jgi:hypothetical protein
MVAVNHISRGERGSVLSCDAVEEDGKTKTSCGPTKGKAENGRSESGMGRSVGRSLGPGRVTALLGRN